jgi:poly(hydroxyalkanoate) granule-associated protein
MSKQGTDSDSKGTGEARRDFREGEEDLRQSAHKIWLAGLGALAVAEEEGGKVLQRLVAKGEQFEARGRGQVERAKGKLKEATGRTEEALGKVGHELEERMKALLRRMEVPTRSELDELARRVEEMSRKVEGLRRRAAAKPPAGRPKS